MQITAENVQSAEIKKRISEVKIKLVPFIKAEDRMKIMRSNEIYEICKHIFDPDTIEYSEKFVVFFLDRSSKIKGWRKISEGSDCGTVVSSKMVAQAALEMHCSTVVLTHNHPSGSIRPSQCDIELTKKTDQAMRLFDMAVMDHLIIGSSCYYSFADEGLL